MKCPFLRESWVKFCQADPYKKIIEQTAGSAADLCTSAAFCECDAFRDQRKAASAPPCPFLHESRAQVCSQDPAVRLVPCSDKAFPRCATENHRYCEIYRDATHHVSPLLEPGGDSPLVIPPQFFFTRNHMWLDVSREHDCHIGLDALLTRVLGRIDKLSFITTQGEQCPSVVLTVHGVNVHMVFPNPMLITAVNSQARVEPERISLDPYGSGWLFEGREAEGTNIRSGLRSENEARLWMERELRRVTSMIPSFELSEQEKHGTLAADGGLLVAGVLRHMKRNEIARFFDELFKNEEEM